MKTGLTALAMVLTAAIAPSSNAGMMDGLVNAANGALAAYGRDSFSVDRRQLSGDTIVAGLREALIVGCDKVVARLNESEGYNADAEVRISLPARWREAQPVLASMDDTADVQMFEQQLNRAAATVAPATRDILQQLIGNLTINNARGILNGGDRQATVYLRRNIADHMAQQLRPIVRESLQSSGALQFGEKLVSQASQEAVLTNLETDLTDHVVSESLDGFFYYLEQEEQAIRKDPAHRTTPLLKRVFG
ncbi:hypothetical protein AB833_10850 [Chromatiales bacterium (ex Bugula neritina AB1)]|nr:hypothetical protein AB833_10850 [Chromatiales bacterium (ex Bugula neritina AB1)]